MLEEYKIIFMRIREYFRKNEQTNWGKLQIIKKLDELEDEINKEKMV